MKRCWKALSIFFLLFHHYLIRRSILCHITSIRDIKAAGYIFIISNHIVFTALCLWGCSWKWKYLHGTASSLIIRKKEKKKKKLPEKPRWKKKEEAGNKTENKLRGSRRSLSRGSPSSPRIVLKHFDEKEEKEKKRGRGVKKRIVLMFFAI